MKVEIFLSSPRGMTPKAITGILAKHQILANITQIYSSVYNKKADKCQVEEGVKVDIFDITPELLIHLWVNGFKNREDLGLHCAWINTPDYNGCILESPYYLDFCKRHGFIPEKCSEY